MQFRNSLALPFRVSTPHPYRPWQATTEAALSVPHVARMAEPIDQPPSDPPGRSDTAAPRTGTHWSAAPADVIVLRPAQRSDLRKSAELHVAQLRLGFFPRLGAGFVARWHQTFVTSPHGVAFVAVRTAANGPDELLGFVFGTTDRDSSRKDLIRLGRAPLMAYGVLALLVRPLVLVTFVRTRMAAYLRRLGGAIASRNSVADRSDGGPVATLETLAVAPAARRLGLGGQLVDKFVEAAAAAGSTRIELVAPATTAAVRFYRSTGWTQTQTAVTTDGAEVVLFARDLPIPTES